MRPGAPRLANASDPRLPCRYRRHHVRPKSNPAKSTSHRLDHPEPRLPEAQYETCVPTKNWGRVFSIVVESSTIWVRATVVSPAAAPDPRHRQRSAEVGNRRLARHAAPVPISILRGLSSGSTRAENVVAWHLSQLTGFKARYGPPESDSWLVLLGCCQRGDCSFSIKPVHMRLRRGASAGKLTRPGGFDEPGARNSCPCFQRARGDCRGRQPLISERGPPVRPQENTGRLHRIDR